MATRESSMAATNNSQSGKENARYLKDELYQRVQKEPELFDWLQQSSIDGLFYWDLQQPENEWMSPEFKKLFGYEDHEVPNTSAWWQDNIFPEDKEIALKHFSDHVGPDRAPYDQVVRYHHKDGSTIWVRCRGTATFDKTTGEPIRMLGAHSDFTKLMLAQETMRQDLKMKHVALDLLTTTALDGYFDWNIKTGHEFLSDRWKQCLGYEPHELEDLHETWKSLLHPNDLPTALDAIQRHMDNGEPYNIVLRYKRKDQSWAHMRAQGVAQRHDDGQWSRMFGTHTDVSDLEEARAAAKSANLAKSTFLATMSHEIRTPLNAVLGMAQCLLTSSLTEEQLDDLTTLRNSGSHLLSLINDLLDFSQIEAGHIGIASEELNIEESIVSVMETAVGEAEKKGVDVIFNSRVPIDATFTGDADRIRQIVCNVLGNAIKFTNHGGTVEVSLDTRTIDDVTGVDIKVEDTGIGMTAEQQEIVFQEFTQASIETRRRYGGTGLGLSICRKLIAAMNGTLKLESALGQGSTFDIWIPGLTVPEGQKRSGNCLAPVLVYEGLEKNTDSLTKRIKLAGQPVITYEDEASLIEAVSQDVGKTVLLGPRVILNQCLSRCLCDFNVKVVTVGRSLRSISDKIPKAKLIALPSFPTSKQLSEALAGEWRSHEANKALILDENTQPLRVLVAEDNLVNQKVIKRLLSRFPCDVFIAINGREAVEMEKEDCFDLIFMDCFMPVMDGNDATREIRTTNSTIPIIALTANVSTQDRVACFDAGMTGFMTKPVKVAELAQVLCSRIESKLKHPRSSLTGTVHIDRDDDEEGVGTRAKAA